MTPSDSIETVIEQFAALPTIGRKTARRLAFHLLRQSEATVEAFAKSLVRMRAEVRECDVCKTFTDRERCGICSSEKRDRSIICVVEEPGDVLAIERTNEYRGLYHVLHGALNPLDGIGPEEIRIKDLVARLDGSVQEIILALNPNVEGEVTTQYIARLVAPLGIRSTRIARGVPIGADLEFADDATLARALEGRTTI
ncbi:MAG TPA: recombination protein RecR [Bacteroidetes bacterium]|nr:recombination protein RecR [Bacteroidota bacterium]HRK05494.1 recombination mediator RecR [Chlorobiota bacterium]